MQDMQPEVIAHLLETYQLNRCDFYAYMDENFYQPFPGIYTRTGLQKQPAAKSLQQLLQNGNTYALKITGDNSFSNYNQLA
jgi:molybdopterin-guanine dinucleotide biosynthesis protein A